MEQVAQLIIGALPVPLDSANRAWLEARRQHNDWQDTDLVRFKEILPQPLWWLLAVEVE
jgi:hypothetical protein